MFHPLILDGIRCLSIASGTLFAFLTAVTVAGVMLIIANGCAV